MRLLPFLIPILRQILGGMLFSIGATFVDWIVAHHKKGLSMLGNIDLLFHPNVTRVAVLCSALLNLAGLCTALGSAAGALQSVFGNKGPTIAGGLMLAGIACAQVAGWGRSTVSAVDNNQHP